MALGSVTVGLDHSRPHGHPAAKQQLGSYRPSTCRGRHSLACEEINTGSPTHREEAESLLFDPFACLSNIPLPTPFHPPSFPPAHARPMPVLDRIVHTVHVRRKARQFRGFPFFPRLGSGVRGLGLCGLPLDWTGVGEGFRVREDGMGVHSPGNRQP